MNIDRNSGEDVVLSEAETFFAQLSSTRTKKKLRSPGIWKGQVTMASDFDDPLPPEIFDDFLGVK